MSETTVIAPGCARCGQRIISGVTCYVDGHPYHPECKPCETDELTTFRAALARVTKERDDALAQLARMTRARAEGSAAIREAQRLARELSHYDGKWVREQADAILATLAKTFGEDRE